METPKIQTSENLPLHEDSSPPADFSYEILNSPEMRAEYVRLTDELIRRMIEQGTEVAIFLDKSARPVAWMVNELWEQLAPPHDPLGQPYTRPEIKFLNIDREQWGAVIGRSEDSVGGISVDRIPGERIEELQSLYAPVAGHSKQEDETLLTDKKVLVVDEVRMSGDTLSMAEKILQRAFPDAAEIEGAYWMTSIAKRDSKSGATVGGKVPVWYSDETNRGRLVADRDTTKSSNSNSSRQRVGRYWLSATFRRPDESGRQLKHEVSLMADELRTHRLPYIPSTQWDDWTDPLEDRIERVSGLTLDEYIRLRKEATHGGELDMKELIELYTGYIQDKLAA